MRLIPRKRAKPRHARRWTLRLTTRQRPTRAAVAAATVVLATASLAGGGHAVGQLNTVDGTMSLDSGSGSPIVDRALEVPAVSVREARVRNDKGTRKLPPSAVSRLDIPATALAAYQRAASVMEQVDESCGLSWTLLAAIGRVESNHGRYAGGHLRADGTTSPKIRGVALDGRGPVAMIRDTDAGLLDGDAVWDRAVGPMQFLPSTWSVVGVDADGDGVRSADDIDDAALATAVFLCSAPGELDTPSGLRTAVLRYNPSSAYVASVLAVERSYRAGEFETRGEPAQADSAEIILATPSGSPTAGTPGGPGKRGDRDSDQVIRADAGPNRHGDTAAGPSASPSASPSADPSASPSAGPSADPAASPTDTPSPSGTPDPSPTDTPDPSPTDTPDPSPTGTPDPSPTETPDPTPDPTPTPDPGPVEVSGVLIACGTQQWCVGDLLLAVGDAAVLAAPASSDFDADGVVESNAEELAGLAGTQVSVVVTSDSAPAPVVVLNGANY